MDVVWGFFRGDTVAGGNLVAAAHTADLEHITLGEDLRFLADPMCVGEPIHAIAGTTDVVIVVQMHLTETHTWSTRGNVFERGVVDGDLAVSRFKCNT
ncbi:hypothetical protein ADT26_04630 [Xanthomonas oryzae]|nr:hypothetical protein ADT26_04630 [Xanthomonas oryzae]